jgi:very-short-patch-repair endonuclease
MNPAVRRARLLRNNPSRPEAMLWPQLQRLREKGYRFRRQAPFRGYVLDFVCFTRRLVIEVDGARHADDRRAEHDFVRDKILRSQGFLVLRVPAREVFRNLNGVVLFVEATLRERPSTRDDGQAPGSEPGRGLPTRPALRAGHPPH